MFVVSLTAVLGIIGLATEVGTWYVARAQQYNAADAAALAGAIAGPADASGAATDIATDNGYPGAVATPGYSATNPTATQVVISTDINTTLARLFGVKTVSVNTTAVGAIRTVGTACVLSMATDLTISQNQNGLADGYCYYASNATDQTAVTISTNGTTITAWGITTPGDCSNCPTVPPLTGGSDSSGDYLSRPNSSFQPPTKLPAAYATLDALPLLYAAGQIICPSTKSGITYSPSTPDLDPVTNCPTTLQPSVTATVTGPPGILLPSGGDASDTNDPQPCVPSPPATYCGYYNMNVIVPAGSTLPLSPGDPTAPTGNATYLFVNSSLTVQNGGTMAVSPGGPYAATGSATYLLVNSSLNVQSGGTLVCQFLYTPSPGAGGIEPCAPGPQNTTGAPGAAAVPGQLGVTFVLTGSQVGTLTIASGAVVNLSAPAANSFSTALDGILFYRRGSGSGESPASPGVNIADASSSVLLNGGMYFPNSYVFYTGNTNQAYTPTCTILIAANLTLGFLGSGDSQANQSQFSNAACTNYATPLPQVQAAQLIQ
jgi:hypothetical protein